MNNPNSSPTQQQDRIHELDIFRGFAILGIFMVNILVMNVCFVYRFEWEMEQIGWLQKSSLFVLETFFYSKFFAIFSLLFGMGVALQIQRAKKKGKFSSSFFIRRFFSLFLFGILHILFLWSGDILHLYGMLGLLLLMFFKLPTKGVLWASILVFIFPFYSPLFEYIMELFAFNYSEPLALFSRQEIFDLKLNGSYLSGMMLRLKEYAFASSLIYAGIAPVALSMMLLGGYLVKKGLLDNISLWLDRLKLPLFISFLVLMIYRFTLLYWVLPNFEFEHGSALSITLMTLFQLSDIVLSLSYLWLIAYLYHKPIFKRVLSSLRYVGRAAFSNYILQSLLAYLIMRTFNYYESFSPFGCIVLVLSIYIFQIFLSKLWLSRFQYGPLEWCWRCISYLKILPIKKEAK